MSSHAPLGLSLQVFLPLGAGIVYVAGVLLLKRAADLGANAWRTARACNFASALLFAPLLLLGGTIPSWQLAWQPAAVALLFVAGQTFTMLALNVGDVSVATPVLGVKIPLVALFTSVVLGTQIGTGLWTAVLLSSVAIGLLNVTGAHPHHRVGATIVLATLAAAAYALFDVLVQKWSPAWGAGRFLPLLMVIGALVSTAVRPYGQRGSLGERTPGSGSAAVRTRGWVAGGAVCFALQGLMIVSAIAIYGQATVANVLYSSRGLWSVLAVWLVGHWFANRERHHGSRILAWRLVGAVLLLSAILIVLLEPRQRSNAASVDRQQSQGRSPTVPVGGSRLERVRISSDGKSFVLAESGRPFRVWGVNYDHDSRGESGRLLEDYWFEEWDTVRSDFREMKDLGANVVRIHLQFGKFMNASNAPNEKSLGQLRRLLALAEATGLYLDITGLGCYHKADTPGWYDTMNETARWAAQARFWSALAVTCRDSPAVFCYDLMNEPVIDGREKEGWLAGELGGKYFVQRLTREPGKRAAVEIAKAWVEQLTAAIRAEDRRHLITVGAIPWALVWPNAKPIFYSPEVSPALDFVSIHVYPKKGEVDKALTAMAVYDIGKPLVIEEIFPLECTLEEMNDFLKRSTNRAEGYISFYWGKTIAEYTAATDKKEVAALMSAWLKYFQQQADFMKEPGRQ